MGAELGVAAKSEPNVVPLCDILLVLLIIFMVITPVAQKGVDIKLPETSGQVSGPPEQSNAIVLTLESDLSVKLNQSPLTLDMLETGLRDLFQTRQDKTIFIRADQSIAYEQVLRVIDIAKGAGIDVLAVIPERYQTGQ